MLGTVKFFDTKRGYGFISPITADQSADIFVHVTAIISPHKLPKLLLQGDEVEFEIESVERGVRAKRVTVLRRIAQQQDYTQRRD